MPGEPALTAKGVQVVGPTGSVVCGVDLRLKAGEIVGLTGPSGSGKSTFGLALLGLTRPPLEIVSGAVEIGGRDLLAMSAQDATRMRGRDIALIVQNPRSALHPMLAVGHQISRIWRAHHGGDQKIGRARALEMLRLVGINDAERRFDAFAHELSGGMAQRALIAAALAAEPRVLIADEPTSGLDVTIQAQFLDLMWKATKERGTAMLLITQEPGIIANYCDRVAVMDEGRIVSDTTTAEYFQGREASAARARVTPIDVSATPVVEVRGLNKRFPVRGTSKHVHAVDHVDLVIRRGETLGLVGESGSGKTTAGRCLLRLIEPDSGSLFVNGRDTGSLGAAELRALRKQIQIVRQDPFDSFDPRWTIEQSLREPLQIHGTLSAAPTNTRVAELLQMVGCGAAEAKARPRDLAAGTLQRLAIARALATNPAFIVLDEPTSVLTPDARREIVALLRRLQAETGVAYLFISHDLTTVAGICHRVAVMYLGQIVEVGTTEQIFDAPRHPYTRALIAAHLGEAPSRRRVEHPAPHGLTGEIPSPIDLPVGCYLASRCAHAHDRCRAERQDLILADDRHARCWRAGDLVETFGSRP